MNTQQNTISLSLWTNPRTGEERVYVIGCELLGRGEKAFFFDNGCANLKIQAEACSHAHQFEDSIYGEVAKTFGIDSLSWEQVLSAAKK